MKDLILLVADKNMQFALKGGIQRYSALGISRVSFDFVVHPGRDGGVRRSGAEIVALERSRFRRAVMVLDFDGSGTSHRSPLELEAELDTKLRRTWDVDGKAIVIAPEVDVWIWGGENAIRQLVGWDSSESIRGWLESRGFAFDVNEKPEKPKEAFEALLRRCRLQRSSALYEKITGRISLSRCRDDAFVRLRDQLRTWFGNQP